MAEQQQISVEEMTIKCLDSQQFLAYVGDSAENKEWPHEVYYCNAIHVLDHVFKLPTKMIEEFTYVARYVLKEEAQ